MYFEGFDFTDFWDDGEYAKKAYIGEPPTDKLIFQIEAELGYKLPGAYIWLMKQHNGGIPVNTCFPTKKPTTWAEDHVAITGNAVLRESHRWCMSIRSGIMKSRIWQTALRNLFAVW